MKRLHLLFIVLASTLCWLPREATASQISISGYYKNYSVVFDRPEVKNWPGTMDQPLIGAVNNRFRLSLLARASERLLLTVAYDFAPRVQDRSLFGEQVLVTGFRPRSYRAFDLDSRLYPEEGKPVSSFAIFQNLDRAHISISTGLADIYLGRQAIAWGSARVINPTDVIIPYAFNELDVEDRMGVDAIRARVPVGFMGEFDVGYIFGDDFKFENSATFLRSRFHYRRSDLSFLLASFRENLLAGLDFSHPIGGAGFWLEAAHVFVEALGNNGDARGEDYFRGSVGLDYSFKDGTYLFFEYHLNQAGASQPQDYLARLEETAYREGSVYLMAIHYLTPGIIYQLTPLVTLSGEALINLNDPSLFLTQEVEYNLAEDIYLAAGAYLGLGKSPVLEEAPGGGLELRLNSEFGAYPKLYFASFRLYF